MKNIEQKRRPESADLATLELKANLNLEQRAYLEVLKYKMKKILGNKTKQELAKAGDLVSLKNYKAILTEILDFLRTKKIGREVKFFKAENLDICDAREFTEDEIIKAIAETDKGADLSNLVCVEEHRTQDNKTFAYFFKVKVHENDEANVGYDFSIERKAASGFNIGDVPTIRKLTPLDEDGNFTDVIMLATYKKNKWEKYDYDKNIRMAD